MTVATAINRALHDILDRYPEAMIFGEDVARKGGVYGVTRGLLSATSSARVFDTLLDEQSILGLALGAGVSGLLPIPEIQYLAYFHNAADQIRGEAATLQFFSNRQYRNPMVVRVAAYGYQKGFGGHFHNDNSIAAMRDIPGVVIASPARPDDAAAMLHTCAAAAREAGAVCIFLEPIALYHTRDLYDDNDGGWLAPYPESGVAVGRARTYGDGTDLTILTFGNGLRMSLRVARRLASVDIQPASSTCGGWRRYRSRTCFGRPEPAGECSSSTKPARPAGSARACWPPWSSTASRAHWAGSPATTASSHSVTPRCMSCCRRTRSRRRRSNSFALRRLSTSRGDSDGA